MPVSGSSPDASLETDTRRAEALLFDLAGELQRTPFTGAFRLHLRALQVKRAVSRWPDECPSEESRRALLDELLVMQRDAEKHRRHAEWSQKLAGSPF